MSKMPTFRKKPVTIEARLFDELTGLALATWCGGIGYVSAPGRVSRIEIPTLEGNMQAVPGDWIIKGVAGEFYPCKPDIFEATYDAVVCSVCGESNHSAEWKHGPAE